MGAYGLAADNAPITRENLADYAWFSVNSGNKTHPVGTRKPNDNTGLLKAPMLTNIALTAPYLHDGSARSLEEIWTVYNPADKHGRTNDLTKDELNDLIEYLRTR